MTMREQSEAPLKYLVLEFKPLATAKDTRKREYRPVCSKDIENRTRLESIMQDVI